ncbi:MAG: HD domain-containing protein [Candidatus Omnitrophica bacterium]|nr:HD domain-containing protein [Candidatus Omnitrophota bacterium]
MNIENPTHILRLALLFTVTLSVTGAHFVLGTETHGMHVIHVFLRSLYLLVIIASSVWFGLKGGLISSLAISFLFGFHILISWADRPMENVNQAAMIVVYFIVGSVSGLLVQLQNREKEARLETERKAQREALIQGFGILSDALKARDEYTRQHSENVARLAVEIGNGRGLDETQLDDLRLAALVHDIGKIGVRDDILFKEDKLSPEEMDAMHHHPSVAAEILKPIKGADRIAEIVLAHHECPDGTGYPKGLRADEIPEEAKILSVADVYCALTEDRPYKDGMSSEEALEIVHSMAGKKLELKAVAELGEIVEEKRSQGVS